MTGAKLTQIKAILVGLAEYYGITLSPNQLSMYADDLQTLSLQELNTCIKIIRTTSNYFPRPSVILEAARGNYKDHGIELSNRIIEAMTKFGWSNPDQAKNHIGELGWKIVQQAGGWARICETSSDEQIPILRAQWRELAVVLLKKTHQPLLIEDNANHDQT